MKRISHLFLALISILSLGNSSVEAGVIGINFGSDQSALASSDITGVIAQANWNNAPGAVSSLTNLLDETGTATTANVTWSSSNTWKASANATPTEKLLYGYLDGGSTGAPVNVSITDISFALYDAYIYINRDGNDSTSTYTVNGQTVTVTPGSNQTSLSLAGITTIGDPNPGTSGTYIHFINLSGDFSLLTSNAFDYPQSGDGRSPVNAIQIVSVPEPSSIVLIGAGLSALFFLRRKNKA